MKKRIFFIFLVILLSYNSFAEIIDIPDIGLLKDMNKNNELELRVLESSSLTVGNPVEDSYEVHKFKVSSLEADFVNIEVDKDKIHKINLGQTKKIDVDNDEIFDISVKAENIRQKTVVSLVFKILDLSDAVKETKEIYEEEGIDITDNIENLSEVKSLQEKLLGTYEEGEETYEEEINGKKEKIDSTEKEFNVFSTKDMSLGFMLLITLGTVAVILIFGFIIYRKMRND